MKVNARQIASKGFVLAAVFLVAHSAATKADTCNLQRLNDISKVSVDMYPDSSNDQNSKIDFMFEDEFGYWIGVAYQFPGTASNRLIQGHNALTQAPELTKLIATNFAAYILRDEMGYAVTDIDFYESTAISSALFDAQFVERKEQHALSAYRVDGKLQVVRLLLNPKDGREAAKPEVLLNYLQSIQKTCLPSGHQQ
ncbi:MAG: hypothetical protein MI864_07660 [Pseudomonadales bacterium]|nr:hypothetical protein [Pseudomonadales bacterium]